MIPKTIHYCWFGGKRKPKLVKDCISSWKKILPEYKIIEWNESNCDLSHPFVKNAYNLKKWAFVSDYIRLTKLFEFGGIYLDTDMMVIKKLDFFLNDTIFFGAECSSYISCGIIGAEKNNSFIEKCIAYYKKINTENIDFNAITIPAILTKIFKEEYNFSETFLQTTTIGDIKIYTEEYFYAFPNDKKSDINNYKNYLTPNSHAVHLWNASWVEYSEFLLIRKRKYFSGLKKAIRNIASKNEKLSLYYFKRMFNAFKDSLKK